MMTRAIQTTVVLVLLSCVTMSVGATFPPAGQDNVPSRWRGVNLVDYWYDLGVSGGDFGGYATVIRESPQPNLYPQFPGQEQVGFTLTDLSLAGAFTHFPSVWHPDAEVHLQANRASVGMLIDANPAPEQSLPAYMFVDVFLELRGWREWSPGNVTTRFTNQHAVRFGGYVDTVPPDLERTPLTLLGHVEDNEIGIPPSDPNNPMADPWMHSVWQVEWSLFDGDIAFWTPASWTPEPHAQGLSLVCVVLGRGRHTRT